MANGDDRPLLNPVLRLKMDAKPEVPTGGGKGRLSVVTERLSGQQKALAASTRNLFQKREALPTYGGRAHLLVQMFPDSLAPSHTPDDLFSDVHGAQLVAPFHNGYVVEVETKSLPRLTAAIERGQNFGIQADTSRVQKISPFSQEDRLRKRSIDELWNAAPADDDGRLFVVWFAPFRNREAQEDVLEKISELSEARTLLPIFPVTRLAGPDGGRAGRVAIPRQSSIGRALRSYRNTGIGRAAVHIPTKAALITLLASGVSHRIDPVRPIVVAAPGTGTEPSPSLIPADAPIVGVIDGGLHAASLSLAEAWRANPPLISDAQADRRHGNAISSLVAHGHAWNANRHLPELVCRIGTVQAVPNKQANRPFQDRELIEYLEAVVRAHPDTHVWNISANQDTTGMDPEEVSLLGHEIAELARAANILPVVSVGNRMKGALNRPSPPADCEAALTVGGRVADKHGKPAGSCSACVSGPGPDGMLKPDVSWFSELRMIGGVIDKGSSYPTALTSSLAAHTYSNLREPTPDLVKALLINNGECGEHDAGMGWGAPFQGHLPWICEPGSVTLAWRAHLQAGAQYYWNDIPIPREMIRDGKLYGRVCLTAILRPLVSPHGGANYFSSRLETSLRLSRGDKWHSLAGSMLESTLKEADARQELKKWQPVRRHSRDFTRGGGLSFDGKHLQLYARVYTRDLYQFDWSHPSEAGPQEVAFVLTLWSGTGQKTIYNSMVQELGNFVESAVVNQEIDVVQ